MNQHRYNKGLAMLKKLHGDHIGESMVSELGKLSPDFRDMTIEWAFGQVASRQDIDLKTRELTIIAACITRGDLTPQLRAHYHSALKVGATKEEIIGVIIQMIFYAGMAAASNELRLAIEVLNEE